MKALALIALLFAGTFFASAETVKLKITYKGDGLKDHKISVMLGDAVLGTGTTDSDGEVSIMVSSLPTNRIDLKGEKSCDGARKSWSASGFVTLDNNNYAHVKMEELVAEMVSASGGMMSEGMLVSSYGLVCSGSSSSSGDSANSSSDESSDSGDSDSGGAQANLMTKEEMQANQKMQYENKIDNLQFKINKKQGKIDSGKLEGDKKTDAEYDIREWEIEQKITQNKLDKLNLQIEKGMLNKLERSQFKEKEAGLKQELKDVKAERKGGSSSTASGTAGDSSSEGDTEEASDKYEFTPEKLANMSNNDLKKKKIGLKSDLSKKKLKLKTRRNAMSPNEVTQTEEDIAKIETAIEVIDAELATRKGE